MAGSFPGQSSRKTYDWIDFGRRFPERASQDYVEKVFDDFADTFETVLEKLEYRVPQLIESTLEEVGLQKDRSLVTLDAGCGTGHCGPILREYFFAAGWRRPFSKMLDVAARRDDFDELIHQDLIEYFNNCSEKYGLIISADTFNYFGRLDELFGALAKTAESGSRLIFTLEKDPGETSKEQGFKLQTPWSIQPQQGLCA